MRESRMTRNGHVRFGERGRETRLSQGRKVRSAPTLLSPLLMNVALHGMETTIIAGYSKSHTVEKPRLIRYADDFVIFHSRLEELLKVSEKVTCWLQDMGLSLSPKKTRITHTLTPYQGQVGFDFLGFTFRQFPVGKTQTGKDTQGKPLGFKTLIKPSKEGVKRHTLTIKGALRMHSTTPIQRYTKVKGMASPYDGNTLYWSQRLKTHPLMHETKARLLRKQQGKCRWCELYFKDGDVMEIDHLDRNRNNNDLRNKMLLHRHCHDERHAKLAETEKIRKRLADAGINIQ